MGLMNEDVTDTAYGELELVKLEIEKIGAVRGVLRNRVPYSYSISPSKIGYDNLQISEINYRQQGQIFNVNHSAQVLDGFE